MTVADGAMPLPIAGRRVAAEIRAEIARQDLTQKEFAAACHTSQPWVSRRLTGGVPLTLNDADIMAKGLGLTIVDLIARAYTPQPGARPSGGKVASADRPLRLVPSPRRMSRQPQFPRRPLLQVLSSVDSSGA